jgi:anti-sigma regulatory factor (Ser/Thr protein kinase)
LSRCDELTIAASVADVGRACEWFDAVCGQRGVPQVVSERLALCLYEILANIVDHGGGSALAAPIALKVEIQPHGGGSQVSVTVSDGGIGFNPLAASPPPQARTIEEASPGGLGLVMIRRCSDWADYRREGERNHLTFGARWAAP